MEAMLKAQNDQIDMVIIMKDDEEIKKYRRNEESVHGSSYGAMLCNILQFSTHIQIVFETLK